MCVCVCVCVCVYGIFGSLDRQSHDHIMAATNFALVLIFAVLQFIVVECKNETWPVPYQ